MNPTNALYWTAEANVVAERRYGLSSAELRPASQHFVPGAKVYIIDWFPGTCDRVVVVGLHRKTKRMIKLIFAVEFLEKFRAQVCYTPAVIEKIKEHYSADNIHLLNQELAESLSQLLPIWKATQLKHFNA